MNSRELLRRIQTLIHNSTGGRGIGILSTTGRDHHPHATWMGTLASPSLDRLITMTSPDSRKTQNILENPRVEWLFTSRSMSELVYLRGNARILKDPNLIKTAWNQMPDKSRAYFLSQQDVGITFFIIETRVDAIEYRLPREERHYHLGADEITDAVNHR